MAGGALGLLAGSPAQAALSATATIDSSINYLGDAGKNFTFTVTNNGTVPVTDVQILNQASGIQPTVGCPTPPTGWTATFTATQCRFITSPGPNAIAPAASKNFVVRVTTAAGPYDQNGSFGILLNQSTYATPYSIPVKIHAWEITDVSVVPAALPVNGPCPASNKIAPKNVTVRLVVCGRNRTNATATPSSATLAGTFIAAPPGTWTSGPVTTGATPRVLGNWSNVSLTQTAGPKTVIATVSSAYYATSPATTFSGFTTNQPPVAVNDGPYVLNEDSPGFVLADPGIMANDSDPDGDTFSVKLPVETLPLHGTLTQNAAGGFTYVPAANYNGTDSYTYRVTDTASADSNTATVSLTINAVQDAPTAHALSPSSVAENQPVGTPVGTLSTTDVDLPADSHTYTLVAGAGDTDNGAFQISGNQLQTNTVFNFEAKSSYSIRVRSTDAGTNFFEGPLTVTITNVNEVPTNITLNNATVAENQPAGTLIGTLVTADPDAGDTFTYTMTPGINDTDNASFQISGNQLLTNAVFDYETQNSFAIRVRVTDAGGLFREETGTIQVTNANEAPTDIALSGTIADENQPVATLVGTLSTTDADAGDTHTYTLVAGTGDTDNAQFQISGNQLETDNTFDFETKSSYTVRLRSTDAGGLFFEKAFTITVGDINEVPTALDIDSNQVEENLPVGSVVGAFSSTDPDIPAGDTHTYNLVSGTGDTDNASFTISGNQLLTNAVFDAEFDNVFAIRVRTTDSGGLFFEAELVINIENQNDAPVAVADVYGVTGGSLSVAAPGVLGNDTDQDSGDTKTAVLDVGPTNATSFTLNADGSFTYTTAQTTGSDSFTYHVVDTALASSNVVAVTLNLNIPPVAVNDTTPATPEDTFIDFDVSANDTDADGPNSALTATNLGGFVGGTAALQPGNRIVRFTPAADFNGAASFTYQAFDGASASTNTATVAVLVTPVNDAPVLAAIEAGNQSYTEQAAGVQVTNTITVSDVDDTDIESAAVAIGSGFAAGDELVFTNQNGITGSYATGTGILTLTGTSSKANYQTALRSVTFRNLINDNPTATLPFRTVAFNVHDGTVASNTIARDITITAVNDAPVLSTIEGVPLGYNEQAAAVQITNSLAIFDVDDPTMESATVDISAGFSAGDELLFSDQNGITGSYATGTGILSLTGSATKAAYETALRSITFRNLVDDNPTGTRSIRFKVSDGDADSNTQTRNVSVSAVNDAPTLTAIEPSSQIYSEQAVGVQITNTLTVTDVDDTNVESADVRISAGFNSGDELVFLNQNGISGSYATGTGILTLTGTSSVGNYQTALRSIQFRNLTNDDPTNPVAARTVAFKVNDGSIDSNTQNRTVTVSGVNDRPVVTLDAGSVAYTENAPGVAISPGLTLADPDNANLTFAQVDMSAGGFVLGQDTISFTGPLPPGVVFSGVHPSGVAQWVGSATKAQYEALLRTVTYSNTADNFTSLSRTVTFRVGDGTTNSVDKSRVVTITPVNDAPTLAAIEAGSLAYTEQASAVQVTNTLTVTDPDDINIESGVVDFSAGFQAGDELLFVNQNGISGSYATGTGVLTLTGTSSVADYQTALRSITFRNLTEDNPTASRTVRFKLNDGTADSNLPTRTVAITAVNDPPTNTVPSSPQTGTEDVAKATPMSVADPDATSLKVTLTAANGTMTMTTLTGLSFTSGDGINDTTTVFTGAKAAVNAALASLSYLGNANYNAPFAGDSTVTILSDDQGATGTGGTLTDSDSVQIDLAPVNDAPVPAVKNITLNANMAFNDVANMLVGLTDPDSGDPGYVAGHTFLAPTVNTCTGANITDVQQTSNGSFDINPPPGSTTSCALQYTVTDNGSPVGPAAVSAPTNINVTINGPVIWFVDTSGGNDANKGRLTDPFKTIAAADAVDAANHKIFLYQGTNYANGITLQQGEHLIGQGVTGTSFDSVMGVTPSDPDGAGPQGTLARPSINGTRPEIDNKVTFGSTGGVVRGLNLTPASGTEGIATVAGGADGLTVGEVSVTTSSAAAINFVNSSGTASFTEVDSSGGTNGIIWNNTSAEAGSLTITGTGSANCTSAATCTGGAIESKTGPGVLLNNLTGGASFTNFLVQNGTEDGIRATSVNGFTLNNGMVHNNGDASAERGIELTNVTGTGLVGASALSDNATDNLYINNNTGTLTFTVNGGSAVSGAEINDGILVDGDGPATVTLNVNGANTFSNNKGDHIQTAPAGTATGTYTTNVDGNTFTNTSGPSGSLGSGLTLGPSGTGHAVTTITNNNISNAVLQSISAGILQGTGTHKITITGNTIGNAATAGSGGSQGIEVFGSTQGTVTALITNNTIRNWSNPAGAIRILANDTCGANLPPCAAGGPTSVTITGNTIANPGSLVTHGIIIQSGSTANDTNTLCADVGGAGALANNVQANEGNGGADIRVFQRFGTTMRLRGYTGAAGVGGAGPFVADVTSYLSGRNTITSVSVGTPGGTGYLNTVPAGAACPLP